MASNYCTNCGAEVKPNSAYCSECGTQLAGGSHSPSGQAEEVGTDNTINQEPEEMQTGNSDEISMWSVAGLGLLWILFIVTFPGTGNMGQAGGMAALSGLAVLASIPLLYVDARAAKQAGVFEARPIFVVIAVYILYLFTMPVYVVYRIYKSRKVE